MKQISGKHHGRIQHEKYSNFCSLLSAPTPQQVINLQASDAAQERIRYLLDGNRNNTLTDGERLELDGYLQLEHFVRQLKIRAREMVFARASS